MPRIRVDIPDFTHFTTSIPVRITDLNYGAHLGNDALLSMLHEARMQLLQSLGYSELNLAGVGLIIADVAIVYKGEAFYGDVLTVKMAFNDLNKYGFDVAYHVLNQQGKEIARAKTGMLCFDYKERKVMSLPDEVKAKIETTARVFS